MKIIGITGGVGAGKTQILKYIEEHYSCRIIRADEAAHLLEEPGQECYEQLVTLLGKEILQQDGMIDKAAMADRIFGNPQILEQVNAITIRRLSNIFWNRLIMRKRHKMLLFSL